VTRTIVKPTHMIGGYAQQSYGFNYYGTVGSNRDEFIVVRKMKVVDWLDDPLTEAELQAVRDPETPGVFAPSKAAE
jgi:nitrate reductase alpha subunit